ncbi:MAG: DUF1800 family protein [Blastocatellia bacterium]|nr:DUF1800 family protein [Blastocatellia bacterium]
MTSSLPPYFSRRLFAIFACVVFVTVEGAANSTYGANLNKAPVLISDSTSTRAIALESITLKAEPFPLTASVKFGSDARTRICVFAQNLELLAGEGPTAFSADVQDAAGKLYSLKVEYSGPVAGFPGITMLIVRLADDLGDAGDVLLRLNLHGVSSNRVRIAIGHVGGGPANDPNSLPTPITGDPTIADPVATPNYSSPSFAEGADGIRFLEQATWGPTYSPVGGELARVRSMGYANWINDQFNQPPLFAATQSNYPTPDNYPTDVGTGCPTGSPATCGRDHYTMYPLQIQFFQNALTRQDQLRQRVAFALHQLIPVSGADLNNQPAWVAPTLQVLDRNAFGNFRQILKDVTLNAGMGEYLNMRGNSKVSPNENYAREVMQLFSVGVDLLNQDGTPVLDAQGNHVPTYSQADITNFARVFTGWNINQKVWVVDGTTPVPNYTDPMVLVNNFNGTYDVGQKTVLNGMILPACANCTTLANAQAYKNNELNLAIDNLFNHQNTGPYLCTALIHNLVTSNPSPAYVGRCSAAFANNGSAVRGDMKAVIKAILLDIEARGDVKNAPAYGHLREPVLFATDLLRRFNGTSDGNISATGTRQGLIVDMGQNLFNPPTVFSYYPADLGLPGTNLLGPEFGILDTSTTYKRANFVNTLFMVGIPVSLPDRPSGTQVNYSSYQAILTGGGTPQNLVDALDNDMMHNTMSSSMKSSIVSTITAITNANATTQAQQRTQTAIYLIATSSQYQVER